jgi:hypothetical protein
MADKWYFAQDGVTHGPYSAGQLKEEAAQGRLLPQDTVWKEGLDKRVLASRVQHLFAAPISPPVPAPAPQPEPVPPPAVEAAPPAGAAIPDDSGLVPLVNAPAPPAKAEAPSRRHEAPKKRVLHIKGGILSSQDGTTVKFRKQCPKCGYLDTSITTMLIPNGCARPNFFCPRCKRGQQVEVQGVG